MPREADRVLVNARQAGAEPVCRAAQPDHLASSVGLRGWRLLVRGV
jgi:hypothetical protein